MKILMVSSFYPPYHVGGACMHVYYLANALAEKGHEVHVLYSQDAYFLKRKKKPNGKYPNHKNVILHALKTPIGKFSPLFTYITGKTLFNSQIRKVFDEKYDIIHYHNVSLFGPDIFSYGNAKKVYTAHDHWLVCPLNDMLENGHVCEKPGKLKCQKCLTRHKRPFQLWRFKKRDMLKEIDVIISPSEYLKGFLLKHKQKGNIVVLPNFVPDVPNIPKSITKDYFFFAGMLEDSKGIRELVEIFKGRKDQLVIAGCGSLNKFVSNLNLPNIKYVGWINGKELFTYFKNAKAFILPSKCNENSPLTIMESFSVGTPAIGSKKGGIPEIINRLDKNLCFSHWDELEEMLNNFDKTKYSKELILKIYQDNFSTHKYLENYEKLILEL